MIPTLLVAMLSVSAALAVLLRLLRRGREQLEQSRARAQLLAFHDSLTGLPNRALFEDRLAGALARARRSGNVSVLLIDLDRFKNVNDTLGHQAGDALLCQVATRLLSAAREMDTVARLGGDEFAIVLENCAPDDLERVCQRILFTVGSPFELCGSRAFVGASIGVASVAGGEEDPAELVRKADIALYQVKGSGRQNYRIFSPDMDDDVKRRGSIEVELRKALATGEGLGLHYQPIVSGGDLEIVGLEALLRCEHPRLGPIPTDHLVTVAEEAGLIGALGDWVLREAAREAARWPHLRMAVNLAPSQLRGPDFCERLLHVVTSAGVDPAMIELEMTERVLLADDETVLATLARLRRMGFRIVLDDFGTGYSSLSYLQKFEFDKIKIDRSFIQGFGRQDGASQIISAILALGKAMDLTVTAEGVEMVEQKQFLMAAGCEELQGYLFSRALPAEELAAILAPPHPRPIAIAS